MIRKLLILFFSSFFAAALLINGFYGERGYIVNQKMESEIPKAASELEAIQKLKSTLTTERDRLEADYQRILEEAYSYGYIQEDEFRFIYENESSNNRFITPSSEVSNYEIEPDNYLEWNIILFYACIAAICFTVLCVIYIIFSGRRNRPRSN